MKLYGKVSGCFDRLGMAAVVTKHGQKIGRRYVIRIAQKYARLAKRLNVAQIQ